MPNLNLTKENRPENISISHWDVLGLILEKLAGQDLHWVLTGSMALALQGLPVFPNDVDLQTDTRGAFLIEQIFKPYIIRPVVYSAVDKIRSQFGAFMLKGIEVEIIGDIQKRMEDGSWTSAPDLERLRETIEVDGLKVPVLPLDYEAEAYAQIGKVERSQELLSWLSR
jgi:hypothetical protein